MIKADHLKLPQQQLLFQQSETLEQFPKNQSKSRIFQGKLIRKPSNLTQKQKSEETLKQKMQKNLISLDCKDQVQSLNQNNSICSQERDIDQQNDIVNDLSYIEQLQKADQQDEIFFNLTSKERILYANSKKHQGNQYFKQNNLEQAIQSYKFGLSLLKPQTFQQSSAYQCLSMAELTSNILYNMGTCYFILMSYRYAIKFYDQAILIKPNYTKAIHNRALCHLEQEDLLKAFQDIKIASSLDKSNVSIQADLKKIENQYHKRYRHHHCLNKQQNSLQIVPDKKILSRSMMENQNHGFNEIYQFNDLGSSLIYPQQLARGNNKLSDAASPQRQAKETLESKEIIFCQAQPRQKIKSFYGKNFYQFPSKFQKQNKSITVTGKSIAQSGGFSPKFRPNILNKSPPITRFPRFSQNPLQNLQLQNSAGQLFQREKRINKIKDKIQNLQAQCKFEKKKHKQEHKLIQNKDKIMKNKTQSPYIKNKLANNQQFKQKLRKSIQKMQKKKQDKFWGYFPIAVATGFGLYHSLKAVLGK